MSDDVLQVRDLSLSYASPRGRVRALRGVNLSVPRNTIVGIVGESGCGKSTLLTAVMGLLGPKAAVDQGRILFDGQDLTAMTPHELRSLRGHRVSMIFQDPMTTLNPVIKIERQMTDIQFRERGRSFAEKRTRAIEMLSRVGVSDPQSRLDGYPHHMSGGIRQRISIAMALLSEPDLLLADEPTTALDATLEVQILDLLRELQVSMGCSILYVSHHLGTVAQLCQSVTVMYAGTVVEYGPIRQVFRDPRHPYTQRLLECDPGRIAELTGPLPSVPGRVPDLVDLPPGCIFKDRCLSRFEPCDDKTPILLHRNDGQGVACHLEGSGPAHG